MEVKIVGSIQFKNRTLPVYGNLDEPLFKATDVAELLSYGDNNVWNLTNVCEDDEKLVLPGSGERSRSSQRRACITSLPRAGSPSHGHGGASLPRS